MQSVRASPMQHQNSAALENGTSFFVFLLKGENQVVVMRAIRPKKVGLKRMDAAIDALTQMGFSKDLIKCKVNSLLKEYGGDQGWGFIEEGYYKLVIDSILEDQDNECVTKDADMKDDGKEVLEIDGMLVSCIVPEIAEGEEVKTLPDAAWPMLECPAAHLGDEPTERVSNTGTDVKLGEGESPPISSQLPDHTLQHQRRQPCYGWISCDSHDDKDDPLFLENVSSLRSQTRKERKRRRESRWDVRP